jgi:hypothetical protein
MAYKKDMTFLVGALKAGLDPMSGIDLYRESLAQKRAERLARIEGKYDLQQTLAEAHADQQAAMMDQYSDMGDLFMEGATEGVPADALMKQLSAAGALSGVDPAGMPGLKQALKAMYTPRGFGRTATQLDGADIERITRIAAEAPDEQTARGEAYDFARSVGPEYFGRVKEQIDSIVASVFEGVDETP